jgi:hypothetical protein
MSGSTAFDLLAQERRWVLWRWVEKPSGLTKVPYRRDGQPASSVDPSTWATLDELAGAEGFAGVGIILNGDGLGGIDLDNCRDVDTGEIAPWAMEIIRDFGSYAEVSPSGTGVKILALGAPEKLPGTRWYPPEAKATARGMPHAEVFVGSRYFTLTRDILDVSPDEIVDGGDLDGPWDRMLYRLGEQAPAPERGTVGLPALRPFDEELRNRIRQHPIVEARWTYGTDGAKDRSANDAALSVAMAREGFAHSEIRAALEGYALGQIGTGKVTGGDAERQVVRLLELSEPHRAKAPMQHPEEASNVAYALAEGIALANRRDRAEKEMKEERLRKTPLLSLSEMSIADLLDTEPPEREWIIEGVLPLGVTGTLSAAGGTGKSWAMIQLAVSMALGLDFWGLGVPRAGGVLILSAEDDRSEFHRRLSILLRYILETTGQMPEGLTERIAFADRVGDKNLLTAVQDGQIARTDLADRIVATAQQVPECRLIIADPLSRFRGGSANGEEEATRFVEALEYVRKETGATVLVPSHTGKDAGRTRDGSQHAVRGSSALVDGMRWVGTLMGMSEEDAKTRQLAKEDAKRWVRLEIPKNNYAPPFDGCWLHRKPGGILVREEPADISGIVDSMPKAEQVFERVVRSLVEYVDQETREGRVVYQHQLKLMAGTSGFFKVGEKQFLSILKRAFMEGKIDKVRSRDNAKYFEIFSPEGA